MMDRRTAVMALLLGLAGCEDTGGQAARPFANPIDFSFACEGPSATQAPTNDETAANDNNTRMCPDITDGSGATVQGDLLGVVLNRQPPSLVVVQMNPASGTRTAIDANRFVPGTTGIPVGREPVGVVRASDYSAFYVMSARDQDLTRVVLNGYEDGELAFELSTSALPGVPASGVEFDGKLWIAAADAAEIWLVDISASAEDPPVTILTVPDRVQQLVPYGEGLFATWVDRPVVSRLDATGAVVLDAGLVPACRDTLDNDDDNLTDRDDPDCQSAEDDDEGAATGAPRLDPVPDAAATATGVAACNNGIDDDGDGTTDFPDDPACANADDDGEWLPGCSDGIDNDGDGATDYPDDPSCYSASQLIERRLPREGPFRLTVIPAGDAGTFLYVLNLRVGEIVVYELIGDDLVRVDVNADDVDVPILRSVARTSLADEREDTALPATRLPAKRRAGRRNIDLETSVTSLSQSQLRGELWERIIEPEAGETAATVAFTSPNWLPSRCAADRTDTCAQPAGDDQTWYAFGPQLDGRIAQIEVVRRGVATHRLAPRQRDPSQRTISVTAPRLTLRGRFVASRGEAQPGYAFIGAAQEELLSSTVVDESPARLRRFGVWPADDFEQVETEGWALTYEGEITGTSSHLGRLTADDTFVDPNAAFCEAGVQAGDWLALDVPMSGIDPALVALVEVPLADAVTCPLEALETMRVEVPVTRVGMTDLGIAPSQARLRPTLPTLDEDAIAAAGLSLRACEQALEELDDRLGLPENLTAAPTFGASMVPSRVGYAVRVGESWAITGTVSGFLHRQVWNRAAGACETDDTLDARYTSRHAEANVDVGDYQSCPPPAEQLDATSITELTPEDERFTNFSLAVDILPACEELSDGSIAAVPSQQDTSWTFTMTGPRAPSTLAISESQLGVRVPILDFRRQLVQLDAAANRASILQVRPGEASSIHVFQ